MMSSCVSMPDDPAAAKVSHWRSGQIRIKKKKKNHWLRRPPAGYVFLYSPRWLSKPDGNPKATTGIRLVSDPIKVGFLVGWLSLSPTSLICCLIFYTFSLNWHTKSQHHSTSHSGLSIGAILERKRKINFGSHQEFLFVVPV